VGPEIVQAQVDALPDARLVTFPDLGHLGPLEALRSVAASILETVAPRR
jgi:pimeloyl-ACP methyl ester carboxylesterase